MKSTQFFRTVEGDYDIDTVRKTAKIIFADGNNQDSVGDIWECSGTDVSRHIKNPVAYLDHFKTITLPIALCEDEAGNYTVELDPVQQIGTAVLFFYRGPKQRDSSLPTSAVYEHQLVSEQVFDLAVQGFLRGGSFSYRIINAVPLPSGGLHLLQTELLEVSLVSLPANADTVREIQSKRWDGKRLVEPLQRALAAVSGGQWQ